MTAQQLKNSILQMAVQGKLVPQDPTDEPASVLLERIRAEKVRLVKEKKIKAEKNPSVIFRGADNLPYEKTGTEVRCIADEVPFDIPDSWEWVRLGSVVFNRGQMKPTSDFCYIDIGSIDNKHQQLNDAESIVEAERAPSRARKIVDMDDILYSTVRPYLHNMCIINRNFSKQPIASTGFAVLSCHADFFNQYLFAYLMSPDFDVYANDIENAKGVAYPAINDDRLYRAFIPIPPVREQHRIVDKLKSFKPYISEYDESEIRLTTLNASFPDALKKSILQYAIQGKLVPQDPMDEPASVLLEHIRAEKEALIKAGKIKRDKHESVIYRRDNSHYEKVGQNEVCIDDQLPFDIPENWSWCRLSSLGVFSSGKTPTMSVPEFWGGNIPWVSSKDMKQDLITDSEMHITKLAAETMTLYPAGTLLLVARSGILRRMLPLCVLGVDSTINQDIKAFTIYYSPLSHWIYYSIKSFEPYILKELVKSVTTVESLRFDEFSQMLIPIPPMTEQHLIVETIEKAITPLGSINNL